MEGFLIAARAVHYSSTISLAGVFAFLCFVAGSQPWPRLRRRLLLLAGASLVLGLLSGVAVAVVRVRANERSADSRDCCVKASWRPCCTARASAKYGVCAFFLRSYWRRCWFCRSAWWRGLWRWVGLAISACVLGSLAWAGHGGATPGRPGDLHLTADILHLLAAGAWVGSLVPLALLLSELRARPN